MGGSPKRAAKVQKSEEKAVLLFTVLGQAVVVSG